MMAWWSNLFKKKERITLDDAVFGMIEFNHGLWCSVIENRIHDFMVMIDARECGPSEFQREFFQRIIGDRSEYERESKVFITSECKSLGVPVDVATLRLYAFEVGSVSEVDQGRFVLEFVEADEIVVHRVEFRDSRPHCYGMDD